LWLWHFFFRIKHTKILFFQKIGFLGNLKFQA
jgi:hypothetical protein